MFLLYLFICYGAREACYGSDSRGRLSTFELIEIQKKMRVLNVEGFEGKHKSILREDELTCHDRVIDEQNIDGRSCL